jgi:hypothetical protein
MYIHHMGHLDMHVYPAEARGRDGGLSGIGVRRKILHQNGAIRTR